MSANFTPEELRGLGLPTYADLNKENAKLRAIINEARNFHHPYCDSCRKNGLAASHLETTAADLIEILDRVDSDAPSRAEPRLISDGEIARWFEAEEFLMQDLDGDRHNTHVVESSAVQSLLESLRAPEETSKRS